MKKIALLSAGLIAGTLSCAFATYAPTGFFANAGAGVGMLSTPSTGSYTDQKTSTKYSVTGKRRYNFAWNVSLGYEQALTQNFSVGAEIGYGQFGKSSFDVKGGTTSGSANFTTKGWDVLANAMYQWQNGFNVFVKGGLARLKQSGNDSGTLPSVSASSTKNKFVAGAGIGYALSPNMGINLTYLHVFGTNQGNLNDLVANRDNIASINMVTLGLSFLLPA